MFTCKLSVVGVITGHSGKHTSGQTIRQTNKQAATCLTWPLVSFVDEYLKEKIEAIYSRTHLSNLVIYTVFINTDAFIFPVITSTCVPLKIVQWMNDEVISVVSYSLRISFFHFQFNVCVLEAYKR